MPANNHLPFIGLAIDARYYYELAGITLQVFTAMPCALSGLHLICIQRKMPHVSELRKDPVVSRWVIIANERGRRPQEFNESSTSPSEKKCPLCEGNEKMTPPEIFALRSDKSKANEKGWKVRVIPNKFPALKIEGNLERKGDGIYDIMGGIGAHEVLVESPKHVTSFAEHTDKNIQQVLLVLRSRIADLYRDARFRYVIAFKNHGAVAGASLSHSHFQVIAVPITPLRIKDKLNGAREYYSRKERCIYCDILHQELKENKRVVLENELFVVIAPYASRFPFELAVFPRFHSHNFIDTTDEELGVLAKTLKRVMLTMKQKLGDPPYNLIINTAPNLISRPGRPGFWGSIKQDFHWHIDIIPRLTRVAGFEWATGFYINPTSPEEATEYLK